MEICGYRTGLIYDTSRSNWAGSGARPIAWSAWYPTGALHAEAPPPGGFFEAGEVAWNGALADLEKFPVVLLSHGTGGTAESLGWLARALATSGFVVLGANHHGNTGLEPYLPEGFLCWWERATDLSVLVSDLQMCGFFAGRLDLDRLSAVGFSLGGYTALALAGARTSMEQFGLWQSEFDNPIGGPKEFPNVAASIPMLKSKSQAFRVSWARHGDDFSDARVSSVLAIAPAPTIRAFLPETVASITTPITLLTGGADTEAPSAHCADWIVSLNSNVEHHDLGRDVGHYTFLDFPQDKTLWGKEDIFCDHEGVERKKVHQCVIDLVAKRLK